MFQLHPSLLLLLTGIEARSGAAGAQAWRGRAASQQHNPNPAARPPAAQTHRVAKDAAHAAALLQPAAQLLAALRVLLQPAGLADGVPLRRSASTAQQGSGWPRRRGTGGASCLCRAPRRNPARQKSPGSQPRSPDSSQPRHGRRPARTSPGSRAPQGPPSARLLTSRLCMSSRAPSTARSQGPSPPPGSAASPAAVCA